MCASPYIWMKVLALRAKTYIRISSIPGSRWTRHKKRHRTRAGPCFALDQWQIHIIRIAPTPVSHQTNHRKRHRNRTNPCVTKGWQQKDTSKSFQPLFRQRPTAKNHVQIANVLVLWWNACQNYIRAPDLSSFCSVYEFEQGNRFVFLIVL